MSVSDRIIPKLLLCASCSLAAFAQGSGTPVAVSVSVEKDPAASASATISRVNLLLTNTSDTAISGIAVVVDFKTATGKIIRGTALGTYGVAIKAKPLAPGDKSTEIVGVPYSPQGENCTVDRVFVDYVAFANGRSWGPDETHSSLEIRGTLGGWNAAYRNLNGLLNREGLDAVAEELRSRSAKGTRPRSN